jgi:hypothetical protein
MNFLKRLMIECNPSHKPLFQVGDSILKEGTPIFESKNVEGVTTIKEISSDNKYYLVKYTYGLEKVYSVKFIDTNFKLYEDLL